MAVLHTRHHFRITGHKRISMKTVTKDEAAIHDDEVATSDIAPILDIATFMKHPFTESDVLDSSEMAN